MPEGDCLFGMFLIPFVVVVVLIKALAGKVER